MKRGLLLAWPILAWLLIILSRNETGAAPWGTSTRGPVPEGAQVTIACDKGEYFLGENVLLHFTLTNAGSVPFEADFGGDYRGATRALRFDVTAIHESGRVAEDPDTSGISMGGFGGPRTLEPGDTFVQSLPLMRYRRLLEPGRYTIRVTHDYGWKEGERKRPSGEISLVFRMPTTDEAEAIVIATESLPSSPNNIYGQRGADYADFSTLCYPVYLDPLLRRAKRGDTAALAGICWIDSVEATKALIELGANQDRKLGLDAVRTLAMRLPDPMLDDTNGFAGFPPFTRAARRALVKKSWDAELAPAVRELATTCLERPEIPEVAAGAFLIQAVGTSNEAAVLKVALDRLLDSHVNPRRDPKDNILDHPEGIRELLSALSVLHSRGYSVNEDHLSGDGAFLLYFTWVGSEPPPRSKRWLELLNVFGENCRYPVRVAALNSIPSPVPPECLPFVMSRLADKDLGVVRAACTVAGRSGNKAFIKPLLEIVATEHHQWLLREASDAAGSLGSRFELLEAWADRLADEQISNLALENLNSILDRRSGSWLDQSSLGKSRGERLALRRAWKAFLARHAEDLRAGKKFSPNDPELSPALVGRERNADGI